MAAVLQGASPLDVAKIREDFPILSRQVHGRPLVYLDSAASAQRPRAVIDVERRYAEEHHSNVHRGVHALSQEATALFEGARERVRRFLGARSIKEIIFTRGTTEAINLVAQSFGRARLKPGDEIVISWLEHHANIVPWQFACEQAGAVLRVVPISERGEVDFDAYVGLLNERTRMVALAQVSNALGTVVPVERFITEARSRGIATLVDGAQGVPHSRVDVQTMGCDFYAFSGHKLYGPTGIGVLYGREELLGELPPWQGGGDMILKVSFEKTTFNTLPYRFEAGTPNISGAIGLAAAIDYVETIGIERIHAWEQQLLEYATERIAAFPGARIIGTAPRKAAVVSFVIEGIHPHDLGTILDMEGVAIRTGHHCAMPVMEFFRVPATARASFGVYNTREEIDALIGALHQARRVMG
ncbi:MAG: cysteine desulfurase [Steroidobacteraceae bacterium]